MLKETLSSDLVTTALTGRTKSEVIHALMDIVCRTGKVRDREAALRAVLDHEVTMSTGMENGIAIPHAKTDAVDGLVACVGVTKHGVDFESLDRRPARIFIMTLSPVSGVGPHVQFLAEISRILTHSKHVIIVENNYSGQFARFLRSETGFSAHGHIRKYDGEPFMPHHVVDSVKEQVAGKATLSVPSHELMV